MTITVYIPCYNAERTLAGALASVLDQTHAPDEILVIDDGSSDSSAEVAYRFTDSGVRVLAQSSNKGLAAARNRALAESHGEILVGLDADVAAEPDYIDCVHETFRARPDVMAMCGRLMESHLYGVANQWRAAHMHQDHGPESLDNPVFLFGCTTAIRRTVAERLGGWDERFRSACEDVELSVRLRKAGFTTRYEVGCRAYHLRADSMHTVLDAFWRWHAPLGDLAGHFDSVDGWMQERAGQLPWQVFLERVAEDIETGCCELLPLTLLMPWWMIACDLEELDKRTRQKDCAITEIARRLPLSARSALVACHAREETAAWIAGQLAKRLEVQRKALSYCEALPAVATAIHSICDRARRALAAVNLPWDKIGIGTSESNLADCEVN
jgi:GT2 family glycosyltransferase